MTVRQRFLAVIPLFLFIVLLAGATPRSGVTVEVRYGQETAVDGTYKAAKNTRVEKFFGVNIKRKAKKLRAQGLSDEKIIEIILPDLYNDLQSFEKENYTAPVNAKVIFNPDADETFLYSVEKTGRRINASALYAAIVDSLSSKKVSVIANDEIIKAEITVAALKRQTVLRSSFRTYYGYSSAARKNNIERAAELVNGVTVSSGDGFSFNKIVGARTIARGFKEAPIIIDGKYVGGVGGGVCQVSTTLYNAMLYADVKVTTVHRHTLPVSYVSPSFDAMVSSVSDMKFVNDTGSDLYIAAECKEGYIAFSVYGVNKSYEISLVSERTGTIKYGVEYVNDDTLPEGVENIVFNGAEGIVSRGYMIRRKGGVFVSRILLRRDSYSPRNRVIAKGTAKDNGIENEQDDAA